MNIVCIAKMGQTFAQASQTFAEGKALVPGIKMFIFLVESWNQTGINGKVIMSDVSSGFTAYAEERVTVAFTICLQYIEINK